MQHMTDVLSRMLNDPLTRAALSAGGEDSLDENEQGDQAQQQSADETLANEVVPELNNPPDPSVIEASAADTPSVTSATDESSASEPMETGDTSINRHANSFT